MALMSTPAVGKTAPAFHLLDQNEQKLRLSSLKGRKVLVYFYPRADTPGCTTQACGLRDIAGEIGDTVIIGISPDKPAKLKKFESDPKFSSCVRSPLRDRPCWQKTNRDSSGSRRSKP